MTRPTEFSLESVEGLVDNQGTLTDCTAEAFRSGVDIMAARAGVDFKTSPLFGFWTSGQSSGWGSGNDGRPAPAPFEAAQLGQYGICPLDKWPTDPNKVTMRPDDAAFAAALARFIERHDNAGIGTDRAMQQWDQALLDGCAVYIAMVVTEKFFNLLPGDIYLGTADPTATSRYGHAMAITGYSDSRQAKRDKNQYGEWDDNGYAWLSNMVLKNDVYYARIFRKITGIPLVPGYVEPITAKARTYLDDTDVSYELTNSREWVYGSNARNGVVLKRDVYNVTLDGNIKTLTLDRDPSTVEVLQTGNVLNIYWNGGLLATWPICSGDDVLICAGHSFGVTLGMDGIMRLNGNPVSSISTTPIA